MFGLGGQQDKSTEGTTFLADLTLEHIDYEWIEKQT
jgi:hypothetical protein